MAERARPPISDGTGQDDRFPAALVEGYFNVDEMRYETLLAMSAELAATLRFYSLDNEPDGDWSDLFWNDEAVIMAMILAFDLKKEEADFLALLKKQAYDDALAVIVKQAGRVDDWYRRLTAAGQHSGSALSWKLAELIKERLAADLHDVAHHLALHRTAQAPLHAAFAAFDPVWAIVREHDGYQFPKAGLGRRLDPDQRKGLLRSGFYSFFNAISYLQRIVPPYFEESLASQSHGAAIGLFMGFLRLYQKVQAHTNRFTRRHLDFYHYQLLQFRPRPAAADSAYLVAPPAAPERPVVIPAGTEFTAGKGASQQTLLYGADADTAVSDARVAALHTLYFEKDDLLSPDKELDYVTHLRSHRLAVADPPVPGAAVQAVPLFGATKKAARRSGAAGGELGFAVASPVLLLMEGEREIEIILKYADPSDRDEFSGKSLLAALGDARTETRFFALFGKIAARYLLRHQDWLSAEHKKYILDKARKCVSDVSLGVIEALLARGRQDYFYKLFRTAFKISLSAEKDWLALDHYAVATYTDSAAPGRNGIKFVLSLGPEAPPIVAYNPAVHGGAWDTRLPLLRFLISAQADYYPYSLLRDLVLKELVIESRVKGVKQLLAYNNHGQVDTSAPWNPFGPLPSEHSYFIVGSHEAAKKPLAALDLHIEWGELPKAKGGFDDYYQYYPDGYNNGAFKVTATVLRDGAWRPQIPGGAADLFDPEPADGRLRSDKVLNVDVLQHFKPVSAALAPEAYRYDTKARNGFFKFTFTGPEGAFGHKAYPLLLTKTLTDNARVKLKKGRPIPNPPYTPLINRVSLDYTARSVIDCAVPTRDLHDSLREKLFHMHPFGMEDIVFAGKDSIHYLLPRYLDHGNLLIGISAQRLRGALTLFFHLAADASQDAAGDRPAVRWYYLASNRWRPLERMRVLSDTTQGFLSSGIVTLDIPADIDRNNTVLPSEYYWLRVSADHDLRSFSSLYTLCAQALKVTRRRQAGIAPVEIELPAGSIRQPASAIAGLAKVQQLDGSFGGRGEETPFELKTRISERLRHKNRACTPWDYERLTLERFPALYKVKCFPHLVSARPDRPQPGHVMMVVVPRLRSAAAEQEFTPMANAVELYQIRDYLQGLAPPFVTITVRNPLYERIQVRCTVKFTRTAQAGHDVKRLNQALVEYLSPWHAGGYQASFGWTIRREDIEAYIRSLDYVDFVTNFSMLHIVRNDGDEYSLGDTARVEAAAAAPRRKLGDAGRICPAYPWSLAIPALEHFIETMPAFASIAAQPTGIDELEVGNTFIINADRSHG